ncbi:hypothetical protein PsorP6_013423 [Peronosclerospora sorghi]|uniref:Uncharacterized protein n=1 Tax=Peronosclerospora sorghi TaxID=230839 RepID=A0ACC0VI20_9STRA|nr:hypothetical protein PsorP6_013423 [Peronosclerospora sorghi]
MDGTGQEVEVDHTSRVVILDGGLATEVEKEPRVDWSTSDLWSASLLLDRNASLQSVIVHVHERYVRAGADVVTTVSYQASVDGFKREGVTTVKQVEQLWATSIDLSVQARAAAWHELEQSKRIKPRIAASVGCYGAALADGSEYRGDYHKSKDELVAWHKHRFAFFANHEAVDFVMCETIPCLVEVEAFVELLNEFPRAHAIISVACRNGSDLNSREPIAHMLAILARLQNPSQLLAIGINCTPPQYVESLLCKLNCPWPTAVYPNSGEKWDEVTKKWLRADDTISSASYWEEFLPKWYDAGARFFGGCCRTSPDDIRVIREYFERRELLHLRD